MACRPLPCQASVVRRSAWLPPSRTCLVAPKVAAARKICNRDPSRAGPGMNARVQRHHRLGQQVVTTGRRALTYQHEADDRHHHEGDADDRGGNLLAPGLDELARRGQRVDQFVFLEMTTFSTFRGLEPPILAKSRRCCSSGSMAGSLLWWRRPAARFGQDIQGDCPRWRPRADSNCRPRA